MKGKVVSKGITIGNVLKIEPYKPIGIIVATNTITELERYNISFKTTGLELTELFNKTKEKIGEKEASIFEAHKMILEDPVLSEQVTGKISELNCIAESAIEIVMDDMAEMFKAMDSEYMQERAVDMMDIKKRLIKNMSKKTESISTEGDKVILVAEELTPSDTLELDLSTVGGLLMEKGGVTSHTAILAQAMKIPAFVGCGKLLNTLNNGQRILIDAETPIIITELTQEIESEYAEKIEILRIKELELKTMIGQKSITLDNIEVEIGANIAGLEDLDSVIENDAEAIGLFRTEFIYMNRESAPSEEKQFDVYSKVLKKMNGKPVIFRTMDIGGDKEVPYLKMPKEHNPFLGYRAIRYCLNEPEIFKTQLRAIIRASVYGSAKIMFPMISSVHEFLKAKEIYEEVRRDLLNEGLTLESKIPLGIMVEIPSVAIMARNFAKYVDFFSIGTNDLTQYTLAVDRQNEVISDLYDYFSPSVLFLIKHVIEVGKETNTWVGMCGSAAGDTDMIPLLLTWGIDEISMPASLILEARKCTRTISTEQIKEKAKLVVESDDASIVKQILKS